MAEKKTLEFHARVTADIKSVKDLVENLKAQLENLKLPAGATKNFEKSFERLEGQIRDFESLTSSGVNSLADTKKVQAAWDKVAKSFNSLSFSLKELNTISDQIFPKEVSENIKKANDALENYQNKLKEIKDTEKYKAKKAQISEAEKEVTRTRTNYSNEQKKLANKRDEVAGLEKAWALRAEGYEKQAEKVRKLNEEYQNLSSTLDKMRTDKAALEAVGAIDSSSKVSSKYKNLLSEKEGELADLEDEDKLREKNQKKQSEFEERIRRAQEKLRKAAQNEKKSKNEEKKARWIKEQAEAQAELNAAQNDSNNFTASIEARKEALREEINLMKEHIALAEQVTQAQINEQSKKASEKKAELDREKDDETFKEDKKLKKSLDTASAQLRTLESTSQSAKDALDTAEKAVEDLNNELNNIETEGTKKEWQEVVNTLKQFTNVNLDETKGDIEAVKKILEDYTVDEIKKTPEILEKLRQAASGAEQPIRNVGNAANDTAEDFREMDRAARDMDNLKDQILDFFSISNTIQIFKNAIRDAFDTIKELDAAMTETAVVTDFSVGDMWEKLPEYSNQATRLGTSIKSLYEATTLYYQQGLDTNQAMGVGIETMKMARIANMDAAAATEAMTAALRGFNMEINEMSATRINDVYSELAAITAADTSQIATAMSKTASIAESANMKFETTAALLAQIIETTQEAPETAGTAMKTIIARFTEVKQLFSEGMLTGEDGEGEEININKIDAALKTVGISLKDFLTGAKGIDDIFLELASKWDTLDLATQRYIATTAAGSRQQSRFLAMMSNYDRTMELVSAANNSAGASQKQFGKTLDSLDAKLQKLKNAWDTFTMGLANSEIVKGGVDLLTWILETVNKLTEAFDGIGGSVAKIGLAIAALRAGKGIFNLFTGQAYSAGTQAGAKFAAGLVASIKNIPIDQATTNLQNSLKGTLSSTVAWSNRLLALGMGLKFAAQQMEDSPYAEYADEVSMAGTAVLGLTSALKILTPVAAAANTTVLGLLGSLFTNPIVLAVTAFVALGGALAYIGYQNAPEQVLKRTQKNAEEAGDAAEEAAQKYNELKTSLGGLTTSEEAINNLTVGTQEWRDAVVNLNDEILKLLETYPELDELVGFENGHLTIDYEGERGQEITKQLHSRVVAKQIAAVAAEASVVKQEERVYYYDNIQDFDPLVSQAGAIEKLANEIYKDYSSFDTKEEISEWLNNNNLKQFAQDEIAIGKLYDNKQNLYDYGKYLQGNQAKYDSYDAITRSNIISNMDTEDYSNRVIDLLGKIQVPVQDYTDSWRENSQVNKTNYQQVGKVLAEQLYGEGATVSLNNWNNEVTLSNKDGTESKTMSLDEFKDQAAYYKGSQQAAQQLEEAASLISSMSEKQQDNLDKLISTEGQNMDLTMLKDISLSGGIEQYVSSIFGPEVAQKFESIFGISFEQLESNMQIAMERISKERGALVKRMSKYSSKDLEGYEVNANILAGLELKFGERINSILDGVLSSLEKTGDEALITQGFEQFRETAMAGTKEEMEELSSFIQDIDWSNPIEAAHRLNQEISTGTGLTKEYAQNILNAGSSFLSASSQMQYFFKTEDYDAVKEDIDEIIEKNGELSAGDILDLADEYKTLDKVLKNTKATAGGLAKALELVSKGKLGIYQLTDVVMSALEGFDGLNSMVAGVLKTLSEFDPGMDENEIADFINTAYETLSGNLKAGAVGNNQNFSYLDFFFPGWDKGLEGDALVAQMEYLTGKLEDNSVNMRRAWSDMAEGKDIYGEAWQFDEGSDRTAEDLSIDDTGSSIKLTGWEGKGMTTQDMVDWIADAYNVSSDYAKMMLGDFKNYSADLAKELNTNDFTAAIENAYSRLRTIKVGDISAHSIVDKKVIDMSEIEALAELYGKKVNEVYAMFEGKAFITDFYDDNGFLQETSVILGQLDKIAQSGGVVGARWVERFIKTTEDGFSSLDVTELNAGLGEVGIPESAKAGITQDIVDSMLAASDGQPVYIDVKMSDGVTRAIEVTPEIDVQTAIANAETELANSNLAEAIASAFKNITFSPEINGQDLTNSVIAAIKAADGTVVTILPDENSLNTIRSEIVGTVAESSPVAYVSGNVQDVLDKVASLKLSAECVVTYVEGNTPPGGTTGDTTGSTTGGTTYKNGAIGIKSANYSGTTLVSEEGPELIQKAKGGAYLSGTNGPEMVNIEKGDTVYTAEETKEIFKKRSHNEIPRYAEGYGHGNAYGGGGSGGRSSDDDEETWENSFDKLYNLVRKIDEELRQRERIERRYEKLLQSLDADANKIISVSRESLAQLEKERMLQEQLVTNRKQQINAYQSENSELMKYANVTQNDRGEDILRIDWEAINSVTDTEEGERIEEYVSQLEEWFDSLEEAEDALWEIEDAVEEIKERGKEEYFELEDLIKESVTEVYQEEIDELSKINDSINQVNADLVQAIQNSIDKQRKERDNQRTEDKLAEKRRRLAYLKQDTSGANDMEILRLEDELSQEQEDYTDTLIDQKISELQEQNDKAAKQREQQIKLAQAQLDHYIESGEIWQEVYKLMDEGLDKDSGLVRGSRLEQILRDSENFTGMSEIAKMEWMNDTNNMIAQALAYLEIGRQLEDIGVAAGTQIEFTTKDGRVLTGTVDAKGNVRASDGKTYNNIFQGYDGKYYAGENIEEVKQPVVEEPKRPATETNKTDSSTETNKSGSTAETSKPATPAPQKKQYWKVSYTVDGSTKTLMGYSDKATAESAARSAIYSYFQGKGYYGGTLEESAGWARNTIKAESYYAYKKGGLADFTGPAWLDGTKSRPELVLNARDTQNFIQLKDILGSIMTRNFIASSTATENNGDINYDIDINVETIGSDYDVEQVANKVKSMISENGRYRNNNAISLKR